MLEFASVSKSFGQIKVLHDVSFALEAGATMALVGESGSGKSTLVHLAAGLDTPDAGTVRVDGVAISAASDTERARLRRLRIGIVFQQYNLIPSLTVGQNLSFQARLAGREGFMGLDALAEALGLSGVLERYPEEISGGQQQRVAIGRALAPGPALLLADEPTGNLDETTGDAVLDRMLDLVRDSGAALLMVTHSTRLAARLDRVVTLQQGRLSG